MAEEMKIEFNSAGFREILTGGGVQSVVSSAAESIAARAGDGFEVKVKMGSFGGGRWIGYVSSTDAQSARDEAENKALSRAVM